MIRSTLSVLALAAALFWGASSGRAQCANFGTPCAGGHAIQCLNSAPPRIGTKWQVAVRQACANPSTNVLLFGSCFASGFPINRPVACARCPSCRWYSFPLAIQLTWTWPPRTFGVTLPNQAVLVGQSFCVQNVCSDRINPCVCLSNAMKVTIMR